MQFTVKDWMIDVVVFVEPESTVAEALAVMRRRYIHSVIVNKGVANPNYGIITSTDVSDKIIAQDKNPNLIKVIDIMTSPLITVEDSLSLKECSLLMKEHHIHHVPVVDADGKLIGMISATDFLVAAESMGRAPGERFS